METFADQAAIAIENARLVNELQARTAELTRSVHELQALGEVSQALSSTLDLETVLNTIVSRANQLAGTDGGSVYEYDEQSETFQLRATDNLDEDVVVVARRTPIPRGEGILGRMAMTREAAQIPDIGQESAYHSPLRDVLLRTGTRALLAIPLLREDHLIGGLAMNKKTPGDFAPQVIDLLKTFAGQSALAIQNARLFREIEDKSRELEMANRAKSQFLANMSHELRTPLNAIILYSELLQEEAEDLGVEKFIPDLEKICNAGKHLLALINDVLDLAKIESGKMDLLLETFDVPDMIRDVVTTIQPLTRKNANRLEVRCPDDLGAHARRPDQGAPEPVQPPLQRLQVHGGAGPSAWRWPASEEDEGWFTFRVSDTGIGIDPRAPRQALPALLPDRPVADAPRRRHGPGAGDHPPLLRGHGGRHRGREHAGPSAPRSPSACRPGSPPRIAPSRRTVRRRRSARTARRRSSSSTTIRPSATW